MTMTITNQTHGASGQLATNTVVFFCGKGAEGFAAAMCVWLVCGDRAEYVACAHPGEPSLVDGVDGVDGVVVVDAGIEVDTLSVAGKHVVILDFSFSPNRLSQIARVARTITQLYCDVRSEKELCSYQNLCSDEMQANSRQSGAMLAWKQFQPGKKAPDLFFFIEDVALRKGRMQGSTNIVAWLETQERSFLSWLRLMQLSAAELEVAMGKGRALSSQFSGLHSLCAHCCEARAPCANAQS